MVLKTFASVLLGTDSREKQLEDEEFDLAQQSQRFQSVVARPHVLEQDIIVVAVCDRRIFHIMANQEAENERRRGQEQYIFKNLPQWPTPSGHNTQNNISNAERGGGGGQETKWVGSFRSNAN